MEIWLNTSSNACALVFKHTLRAEPTDTLISSLQIVLAYLINAFALWISDVDDFVSILINESELWIVGVDNECEGCLELEVVFLAFWFIFELFKICVRKGMTTIVKQIVGGNGEGSVVVLYYFVRVVYSKYA